jgi:uncharacterized protein
MATTYKTPGVYVEEIAKLPPSVAPVDTAIPAFIGYTQRDDRKLKPTRIDSLLQFELLFGGPEPETKISAKVVEVTPGPNRDASITVEPVFDESKRSKFILYYALQHFYANGGRGAWIVSAGEYTAAGPSLVDLNACLAPLAKVDEPTLIVIPESTRLSNADYKSLHTAALTQCHDLQDRFVIMDAHDADAFGKEDTVVSTALANFRSKASDTNFLNYGAAYAPYLATVLDFHVDEKNTVIKYKKDSAAEADVKLADLRTTSNQAYELTKAALRDIPLVLPPSAAIAGIYAQVDNDRGVWKAPANVSVAAVVKPVIEFSKSDLDALNVDPTAGKSVNAIRPFIGKGTLVWGARTLAGNDNEWRYVNVRRFFIFAEESIKKATEQFTFEPNDANTWVKLQAMIENFLTTQWRAGALQGVKPEHAFYVAVGLGKTMTALDILEGRLIVEIGLAVVRPAEFIVLRFSHKMAES